MKIGWTILASCLILMLAISTPRPLHVAAQSSAVSRIYMTPVSICCSGGTPVGAGSSVTFNVMMDLVAGQAFNGFDIRINYTNPFTSGPSGTLRVQNLNYSNNVFASYGAPSPDAYCVDGNDILGNGHGCASDDSPSPGQIHFAQGIVGSPIQGPLTGAFLFGLTFGVAGGGNSTIYFDRWNVINPTNFNPQLVPLVTYSAFFGNTGLVTFFNYSPVNPTISVSNIPNQPVLFDASSSVDAVNSSLPLTNFSWKFGDGSTNTTSSSTVTHTYSQPGNYSVQLTVTDARRSGSITRTVPVVPALGNLLLTLLDSTGGPLRSNVMVQLFNSSLASIPFARKTIDTFGQVQFNGLTPGTYFLTFNGQTVVQSSKSETVSPGWTTRDTVLLTPVSPPPDYSWLIYIIPLGGGLAILTAVAVMRRRRLGKTGSSTGIDSKGVKKKRRV